MFEGYRTLRELHGLAGQEFTVGDLAEAADVKRETVRTILARESRYVEEVRRDSTGRRGGRPKVYRLREQAVPELGERLAAIEPIVGPHRDSSAARAVPTSVLAAEELLAAEPGDHGDVPSLAFVPIALAEAQSQLAHAESEEHRDELETHIDAVETLTALHEFEAAARAGGTVSPERLGELRAKAERLQERLGSRDPRIWAQIEGRFARSPLGPTLVRLPATELISVSAERWVTDLVAGVLDEISLEVSRSRGVPSRPPRRQVKLGVLVIGDAARPTEIVRRLAARRSPDERLIVVDATKRGPKFVQEVSRHSMVCIPREALTRESFTGAVRAALGYVP